MPDTGQQVRVPQGFMGLYATLLPPDVRARVKDFFIYGTDFLGIADGATESQSVSIQEDSDFFIISADAFVVDPAGPTRIDPDSFIATVSLQDSGSGRNFVDRPIAFSNVYGTAQLPGFWPYPKLLQASSTLTTQLTNNQGAAVDVRLAYRGFKVFRKGWGQ